MRRDRFNDGASPIVGHYYGDRPWAFKTGKGIFSTPIVGGDGTIYVGSADTWFYAISPQGQLRWRFKTGNLIDSAGFIGRYDTRLHTTPIIVPSGDENLYEIRGDDGPLTSAQRIIWKYKPAEGAGPAGETQLVNWWEGNAEPGTDGTIYAGNTGDAAYAFHPDGTLKWVHRSIGPFWTDPAIQPDGTTYWGSLDLSVHRLDPTGNDQWRLPTAGFVVSSPAMSRDGKTIYIGSFDSNLYAIDTATGTPEWKFTTGDHIYSSPALDEDSQGRVKKIIIASTDGQVYALDPSGHLLWTYDTGDVIRSSPVIGFAADGVHKVVYVGAGNGTLYAIDADTGARRWSYDTTRDDDPVLHDRNDLNGSPALAQHGVVIGGEDGYLKYVPYDYCLHRVDPRCSTSPGGAFPDSLVKLFPVTPGGNTQLAGGVQNVAPATVLPIRLVVRSAGATQDAAIQPVPSAASLVSVSPPFPFTAELSGDGHYIFVVPDGPLTPGQTYSVRVAGNYTTGSQAVGNLHAGATGGGSFDQTLEYRVNASGTPLQISTAGDRVTAFGLTRLAFPLPAFLTSVNQIGFDSYNLVVGAVDSTPPQSGRPGTVLVWAIGAQPGPNGTEQADPTSPLAFPAAGTYSGNTLALSAHNVTLTFSFGPVPVQRLELRAQMSPSFTALPGASIYGEVACATVPTYGPLLPSQRLCNDEGKVISSGTFVTGPLPPQETANQRPAGLSVGSLVLQRPTPVTAGSATATLDLAPGASSPAAQHVVSILLTDAATGQPVGLDYKADTTDAHDAQGNIGKATLAIPAGTSLPAQVRVYVIADVFPLTAQLR